MTITLNASTASGLVVTPDNSGNIVLQYNGQSAPAFSAYADTAQTITSNVFTKVTFGTEEFDTNNNFSSSRFTPTVAGYYQFNANILCKASSTISNVGIAFYKNGSAFIFPVNFAITAGEPLISSSCLVYLNGSTDYLEVYGRIGGTGTITFGFNDSAITSRFSGCLLRGA